MQESSSVEQPAPRPALLARQVIVAEEPRVQLRHDVAFGQRLARFQCHIPGRCQFLLGTVAIIQPGGKLGQKALLVGLVLAQARLVKKSCGGVSPLILLDEIAAHLDASRRLALFSAVANLGAQVWMTGTDLEIFAPLKEVSRAQFFLVLNGAFVRANDAESPSKA